MPEQSFADGLIVKYPSDRAPDFIKLNLSVKVQDFIQTLHQYDQNGWVNIQVKESRDGKLYAAIDTYNRDQHQNQANQQQGGYQQPPQQTPMNQGGYQAPQQPAPAPAPQAPPPPPVPTQQHPQDAPNAAHVAALNRCRALLALFTPNEQQWEGWICRMFGKTTVIELTVEELNTGNGHLENHAKQENLLQ